MDLENLPPPKKKYDEILGQMLCLNGINQGGGIFEILSSKDVSFVKVPNELHDIKIFCFNGKPKFFKIDFGRFVEHHANYYDTNLQLLPFGESNFVPIPQAKIKIPSTIYEMFALAEKLSVGIPFLRVDFYEVNCHIYFGELTFYPANGMGKFTPEHYDDIIGCELNLEQIVDRSYK